MRRRNDATLAEPSPKERKEINMSDSSTIEIKDVVIEDVAMHLARANEHLMGTPFPALRDNAESRRILRKLIRATVSENPAPREALSALAHACNDASDAIVEFSPIVGTSALPYAAMKKALRLLAMIVHRAEASLARETPGIERVEALLDEILIETGNGFSSRLEDLAASYREAALLLRPYISDDPDLQELRNIISAGS